MTKRKIKNLNKKTGDKSTDVDPEFQYPFAITDDGQELWLVEHIIERKKFTDLVGIRQDFSFVKWQGYGDAHNSWIDSSDYFETDTVAAGTEVEQAEDAYKSQGTAHKDSVAKDGSQSDDNSGDDDSESKGGKDHAFGSIVLAFLKGYGFWPAWTVNPNKVPEDVANEKPARKDILVQFFPEGDFAWMTASDIEPLGSREIKSLLKLKKKALYKEGLEVAQDPTQWSRWQQLALLNDRENPPRVERGPSSSRTSSSSKPAITGKGKRPVAEDPEDSVSSSVRTHPVKKAKHSSSGSSSKQKVQQAKREG